MVLHLARDGLYRKYDPVGPTERNPDGVDGDLDELLMPVRTAIGRYLVIRTTESPSKRRKKYERNGG